MMIIEAVGGVEIAECMIRSSLGGCGQISKHLLASVFLPEREFRSPQLGHKNLTVGARNLHLPCLF